MKIAYVTKSLLTGGAEMNICDLCEWFIARGWPVEVVVFSGADDRNIERLRAAGARIILFRQEGYGQILRSLWRYLRSCDADVIHSHMPLANQICRFLRGFTEFPLITTEHNVWSRIHVLHRLVAGRLSRRDSVSLACSAEVAASFPYPLQVNVNGRDFRRFAETGTEWPIAQIRRTDDAVIYVNVANVNRKKDHILLLEAFRHVPPLLGTKKTYLLIAGAPGDNWHEVQQFIAANRMSDRVFLLGPRDDVAALMKISDVFVLSSRHEGLPLTALEAMYLGLPVVSTAVGELPALLQHTDWVVRERSPTEFASRMVAVLTADCTPALVEKNKALARSSYSIDRQATELASLYRSLSRRPADRLSCGLTNQG